MLMRAHVEVAAASSGECQISTLELGDAIC